jgi:tetratricopeptide (TPR) repeat protein
MIGFGSLAREEMTPYSDLEFGILISDDNTKNRKYFKNLTTLIHLKVINLGETILRALNIPYLKEIDFFDSITPRGFAFDGAGVEGKGCKTPLGNGNFKLIQTPEKMAQYIGKDGKGNWWHEKEPHLPMELLTFTHLLGNPELTIEYARKVQLNLNMPYQEDLNLRQYFAKVHLAKKDMLSFDPGMQDLERHGMLFKIKNDFYRFPHLALDRLALLNKIEASDTFTRIDELNKQGALTQAASEKLRDWMNIALFMRLKTYSHYQAQKEMMNPLLKPFGFNEPELIKQQFALDQETLEKIKKIYHVFIPFYQAVKEFLAGNEDTLKLSDLEDDSPQTQGDIAARLFQNKEAKDFYLQALQVDPQNAGVLNALGVICQNQGDFEQAVEYANQALDIDMKYSDKNWAAIARDYTTLGFIYQKQEDFEKAITYARRALHIGIDLFGENHPVIAIRYHTLGTLYKEQGKLELAIQQAKKALAINQGLCADEKSPALARDFNILGMISYDQDQGDLEKAAEYIKQALEIDIKLFGKKHPNVAMRWRNLGMIYQKKEKLDLAIKYTKKALKIDCKFSQHNHPKLAISYNNLGTQYYQKRKLERAIKLTKKALKINLRFFRKNHSLIAKEFDNLGRIYQRQENFEQANKCFTLARRNELKLV